jgi:hypothetical protein
MTNILFPVGRLVQGDVFKGNDKDMEGRPLRTKSGELRTEWFMAVAIRKDDAGLPPVLQALKEVAQVGFPRGETKNPEFAWKYSDGDSRADKEGFKGCHVFRFTGGFQPAAYSTGGASRLVEGGIKRGDYVRVYGSVRANGSATRPGLYLNPSMVELIGHGEPITTGPDAATVFGGAPVAPVGAPVPVAPRVAIAPAPDFLRPMTAKANGMTYEQFVAMGFTDEMLRTQGLMV